MTNNYFHLLRPTTPGQIYDLFWAGKLKEADFESALLIIKDCVDRLSINLTECQNWEIEDVVIERDKFKALLFRMNESLSPKVQGQKAAECIKLAEKNWEKASQCENRDEQLVHLDRCIKDVFTAGLDPFAFIVSKVKESLIAA